MRLSIVVSFPAMVTVLVYAQEETLIGGAIESGGFGGPVVKIGRVKGETALLVGGRGGWIINHTFVLGGGGYGLVNDIRMKETLGKTYYLALGYGGLELEYVANSDRLIHYTFRTLIGAGGVNLRTGSGAMGDVDSDPFFIVEPAADVVLNVATNFRLALGVSYRYVRGVNFEGLRNSDVAGPSGMLTLQFGTF